MAAFLRRLREFAVNLESTKGTFSAPNASGTDSKLLLLDGFVATPEFEVHEREVMNGDLSSFQAIIGKTPVSIKARIHARASSAAGTADKWGDLLKVCGFEVTNSPSTSDVYKPVSELATHKTASAYCYLGNTGSATSAIRMSVAGIAGNVRCISEVGKATIWEFDLMGVFSAIITAGALNAVTHETAVPPAFLSPTFTYGGAARTISRLTWDMQNEVVQREDANNAAGIAHYVIVDRKPIWGMDPEWEATGTENWITNFTTPTPKPIAYNIGTKIAISIPLAQINSMTDSERNKLATLDLSGYCLRNSDAGDDELVITKT